MAPVQAPIVATYTNEPGSVRIDRIRFEVGDTDCRTAFLSDNEIKFLLDKNDPDETNEDGPLLRAASEAASAIAARLARRVNMAHGGVRKDLSKLFEQYGELARELGRKATICGCAPLALGITKAEKEEAEQDESLVEPEFQKGMHDNPRSGPVVLNRPGEVTPY